MELQFKNVTKAYGDVHAVDHVTHSMEKGVYGLLGVNGAGKTTLMRMLCTAINPTSGEILWNGKDIFSLGASYRGVLMSWDILKRNADFALLAVSAVNLASRSSSSCLNSRSFSSVTSRFASSTDVTFPSLS